jgi:aldehyde dehydrogenase (NAD+)
MSGGLVFNVVTGFGETAGAALSAHPDVDKIGFTGSTVTGQAIMRAAVGNLKKLTLELGGKSPDIIFADADLDAAVVGAGMGVFGNTGQMCIAGSRIYVERPIYQEFIDRLAEFAGSLRVGHSLDPQTQIGPVVSRGQLERVTGYLEIGRQEGATAVAGGARLTEGDLAKGFFVPPTVFVDAHDDMRITTEEIFGPVAAVMPFDTLEEVVVPGEPHPVRARGRGLDARHRQGPQGRQGRPGRHYLGQHLWRRRPGDPLRRDEDERVGQGPRNAVGRGLPHRKGGLDQHGLTGPARPGGPAAARRHC